jgi:hypothetical protein
MGLKKLGKWLKKNIKPIATVAAILYPPLIPMIGSALVPAGTSAVLTAAAGSAVLSGTASAISGDKPADILKNAAIGGITGGTVAAVSPTAFDSGLFSGGTGAAAGTTTSGVSGGLMGSTLPATAGAGASTAASLSSQIASQGLVGDIVNKVASFTGLTPDTVGKLGVSTVQSLLSSAGATKQAEQAQQAAQTQADAQVRAAQIAADAAKFRPVGVTTRFGQSSFTTDAQGNVIGAGYAASPEIQGYQNRLSALATQGLRDAELAPLAYLPLAGASQSLFGLGGQYLAKSPEQAAQDYITKQQALLAPTQENQLALLQNKLFQQGRTGAATAQGGNLMATNPEMAAYYNSLAQSNLALAAQADQAAQQRIQFGAGLFDTGAGLQNKYYAGQTAAYQPFATAMDTSVGLENLAQQPMNLGTAIGAKTTAANTLSGSLLSGGITSAAATMAPANAYSASGNFLSGFAQNPAVGSALSNVFGVQQQQTALTDADKARLFDKIYAR